jgi:hypothetical protein
LNVGVSERSGEDSGEKACDVTIEHVMCHAQSISARNILFFGSRMWSVEEREWKAGRQEGEKTSNH